MKFLVSIIITTRNEEKNIENCLISIQEQSYKNIEIIVVDNNSTDKTKEIALKYTDRVYNKGPERSAQRNYGMIDMSNGKYVIFVDADMILAPYLIESCIEHIQAHNDIALHIPEIILGTNYFSKVRRFERSFYDGTVIDGARFFDKQKFIEVDGFDESMSGPEDWDIDKKIKQIGTIGLIDIISKDLADWKLNSFIKRRGVTASKYANAIFHNEADFILGDYLKKKGYYAKSFDTYIAKWSRNDNDISKQFGLWYRYFGVFLENGKWKRVVANPQLTIGMYFLRFMVGVKFLMRKI